VTDKLLKILKAHLQVQHKFDAVYDYQLQIARIIIEALVQNLRLTSGATEEDIKKLKHIDTGFEISRQAGKTTILVATIEFVMIYLTEMFGRPIHIGIFAPQHEQAKTDFDRLKTMLRKDTEFTVQSAAADQIDIAKEESNARTIVLPNGSSCYIFPVTKTSKPESKTLDLIIFEESQDLDDNIVTQQIEPMTSATNGPHVWVGTAGTTICKFYRMGQSGKTKKIYFEEIANQRREAYNNTKNAQHLIYEQTVRQRITEHGLEADEIQRPYFGKWLIGTGQFCTEEELDGLYSDRGITNQYRGSECYIGIDTAKHPDSTIITVLRYNDEIKKKEVINWLELRGENYQNQFDIIREFISNYRIAAIAIDSTGQGDFMPDMFEAHTEWADENSGLYRVKFSAISKDNMYKNLKVSIKELLTTLPKRDTKGSEKFRQQVLDLQQEYKGQLLSVHHPDSPDAHDDYPDSWALAEWAYAKHNENQAEVSFIEVVDPKERELVRDAAGKIEFDWPGLQN
jgi:hypothetical protein